jgi:hypothetical protein
MPFDEVNLNETAAHLLRAKHYIVEHGWCSCGLRGPHGEVCMVAALIGTQKKMLGRSLDLIESILAARQQPHSVGIGSWNDTPGRTLDEVFDVFDRAIALAMTRRPS